MASYTWIWRAVEIDAEGWRIVNRPVPRFRRSRGSQPLPEPERGGSLDELRGFLNIDDDDWVLIRAFLVSALRPALPCPILVAKGEQGAGKSTACRMISSLIDPRTSALRGAPREVRDLVAAARNSWLVCFDNLSHLPQDLADAACRLATGGGALAWQDSISGRIRGFCTDGRRAAARYHRQRIPTDRRAPSTRRYCAPGSYPG